MSEKYFDLIVVGGGAAGIMAAISAATFGCKTAVLDHHSESLKKILVTGNGKCNLTNKKQGSDNYYCNDPAFVLHVTEKFNETNTIDFFRNIGVLTYERDGYVYPRTNQASTVRNALLRECDLKNISIINDIGIRSIKPDDKGYFLLDTKNGFYKCKKIIMATGGKTYPKTGSDGSGYIYVKKLGHTIIEPAPALGAVECSNKNLKMIAGVRALAGIKLFVDKELIAEETGEVQFTDYGLSGIPVFQISRFVSRNINNSNNIKIQVDLIPDFEIKELSSYIYKIVNNTDKVSIDKNDIHCVLSGIINDKLSSYVLSEINTVSNSFSLKFCERLVALVKKQTFNVSGVKDFNSAQVTCGGISTDEINPDTMESLLVPGLYFAGEIIDVDGQCGGYNLQWAWSSGHIAGKSAALSISEVE